jgi:hypothetical protein
MRLPVHCSVLGLSEEQLWARSHGQSVERRQVQTRSLASTSKHARMISRRGGETFGSSIRLSHSPACLIHADSDLSRCSFGTGVSSRGHFRRFSTAATHFEAKTTLPLAVALSGSSMVSGFLLWGAT